MKKMISVTVAVLLLTTPIVAQTTDACQQAALDAQNDVNSTLWYGAGCLFGVLGWGAAHVIKPNPPATRLVGKDPMYVAQYTDCYREEAKKIQTKKALNGCLTYAVFYLLLNLMVLSSSA